MTHEEKQIEEMAKDLCNGVCSLLECIPDKHCESWRYAERAVDKGYRKASEVAEEIFAEIEDTLEEIKDDFRADGDLYHASAVRYSMIRIAELKKKYTEEGKK